MHYNRHRYYDPGSGRFIRKDPIGYAGALNVYAYAPNPISWVDPLGLSPRCLTSRAARREAMRQAANSRLVSHEILLVWSIDMRCHKQEVERYRRRFNNRRWMLAIAKILTGKLAK
nr:RHS repeat-associated core domain-containing protein [Serratia liquefaciens]